MAQKADEHIDRVRASLGFRKSEEFKFNKSSEKVRRLFLEEMCDFDFQYFSIVINKQELTSKGFNLRTLSNKYACKLACLNAKAVMRNASVCIDGSGSREFKRQMSTYLTRNLNDGESTCIKKVKMRDSHKYNLLQLADMVCGSVARFFKDKTDAKVYREIISKREAYVQVWPVLKLAKRKFRP